MGRWGKHGRGRGAKHPRCRSRYSATRRVGNGAQPQPTIAPAASSKEGFSRPMMIGLDTPGAPSCPMLAEVAVSSDSLGAAPLAAGWMPTSCTLTASSSKRALGRRRLLLPSLIPPSPLGHLSLPQRKRLDATSPPDTDYLVQEGGPESIHASQPFPNNLSRQGRLS